MNNAKVKNNVNLRDTTRRCVRSKTAQAEGARRCARKYEYASLKYWYQLKGYYFDVIFCVIYIIIYIIVGTIVLRQMSNIIVQLTLFSIV